MHASRPPSSHVTNPDMARVRHVSEAVEWVDGVVGDGGKQEDQREGRWGGRCDGGQEGVKVGRKVCRKARERESVKLGS